MAKVELSEIPLMFLQTLLDDKKTGKILSSYTNAVQEINNSLQLKRENLKLELSVQNYTLLINDKYEVQLDPREFFVYLMVVNCMKEEGGFGMPSTKNSFDSYRYAIETFFKLLSSFSCTSENANNSYRNQVEKYRNAVKSFCKFLCEKENEAINTNPDLNTENAELLCKDRKQINLFYELVANINNHIGDFRGTGRNKKSFLPLSGDPQPNDRSYNVLFPFEKIKGCDDSYRLNPKFIDAQYQFWKNAVRDIGDKIREKVVNHTLAEHYCIKSDNKSGSGIKIIDLPAENIVIR